MDSNFEFLGKLKAKILKYLEEKDFSKDLEQICDYYYQRYRGKDAHQALIFNLKVNYLEICEDKSKYWNLIVEIVN